MNGLQAIGMAQWLESGLLIFKGVSMGLMDVVVGMEIVRCADIFNISMSECGPLGLCRFTILTFL